ncbi:MAG: hypothetical protein AAB874_06880 [Patescibacteria group bacterium]
MQKLIKTIKELLGLARQDRTEDEEVQVSGREQFVELQKKGLSISVFTL